MEELMESYQSCLSTRRKSKSLHGISFWKRISPANFTKEDTLNLQLHRQVGEVVLQEIKSLNNLDLELYGYAKDIFAQRRGRTIQKSTVTEK
ncbi:protein-tyrosine sulfotransferase-like [Rhodamnia argentea]|uniref:Protein-tyrosine sulfotransferase-like n=1 Tax=Rhodamnia argentea TaxID=178133 RepID=A0A8B8QGI1_9MYRT|nr:protein-tyrosine sulfotransferase-like [Rhodamnia argentea]